MYVFCDVFVSVYLFYLSFSSDYVYCTHGICVFSDAVGDCVWSSVI